ncbi:MAG TPA: alanine--tRNA ligase-related protein [Candidatus Methanoperedens sp.]|nr:alanine--tRNA ligase-related protein [Candidatus Methanoperedens sp.]
MNARDLKNKFVDFFKNYQHAEIPSASIVPENDPTTLFISAGMHPLVPYLLGQPHPLGKRLVDVQKCIRTGDIDEVGDTYHHTFFEMLGNWSLGDYFKKEMIAFSYEFLTNKKYLGLDVSKLAFSCFAGDQDAPRDEESFNFWREQGVSPSRIAYLPKKNNWWGPAGATGPCGPDTEMFYWTGESEAPEKFDANDSRWLEIWNDVFMQYNKKANGTFEALKAPNVDTGMGVERTTAVLSGLSDNYQTYIWQPIIQKIEEISGKKYVAAMNNPVIASSTSVIASEAKQSSKKIATLSSTSNDDARSFRIIADHIKAAVFMIADSVEPSNKERGYVLRRLIRRSIRQGKILGIEQNFCSIIATTVLDNQNNYAGTYSELDSNKNKILETLEAEETKFRRTLNKGLSEITKLIIRQKSVSGKEAFDLYQSFGFPVEMIEEELRRNNLSLDIAEFNRLKEEHQKLSQTLSAGKFKSGLADNSEIITKYHTTTHLMHAALRKVLGEHVEQSGSNITSERLRFDFSHPQKVAEDQLKEVEKIVNEQINASLSVTVESMKFTDAQKSGALAFFGAKYPEIVTVYTVGDPKSFFSKEVCTGPHVDNVGKLGHFEIQKEESAGSGKRRIYAILK